MESRITIIGPSEVRQAQKQGLQYIDTTSRSPESWERELSPFYLGPVPLYGGMEAKTMENAWQYAKVYEGYVDENGEPSERYWHWAKSGWTNAKAVRYPQGKGAKPLYLYWNHDHLPYIAARREVYFPLYRDAVAKTGAFMHLRQRVNRGESIVLFDFDGYDHDKLGMNMWEVISATTRKMGHAFVLKAMLMYGPEVTPDDIEIACAGKQQSLF